MKKLVLILVLTIFLVSQSRSNWDVIITNPNKDLMSIHFADSLLGWTTGGGVILKTTDGGENWNLKHYIDNWNGFDEIQFSGRNTGIAVGSEGKAFKTTDGGESWFFLEGPGTHNWGLCMIDTQNIFVVGHSRIYKTIDGGISWSAKESGEWFQTIDFANNNIGWTGSYSNVSKTTDAGNSWTSQLNFAAYSVFAVSENNVYAVGVNQIYRSTNGGISWTNQAVGNGNLWGIYFPSTTLGYACGSGKVFKTTNGGNSWVDKPTNYDLDLLDVYFATNNIGYVSGKNGTILKTTDGGDDWTMSSTGLTLYDIKVIDSTKIVAVGQSGAIFKTTDAGKTWRSKSSGTLEDIFSVNYVDSSTAWIVAVKGVISKTTNGGDTWTNQTSGTTEDLAHVYFYNNNLGWIVGKNSTVLKTTNGGTSWITQNLPDVNYLQKVQFANENVGYIVGDFGSIYKTTNGGTNWVLINSGYTNHLNHLYFFDTQNGFVVGGDGTILKTTNGGTSWSKININLSESLTSINFLNSNRGVIVGSSGIILSTNDGGANWSKYTLSNKNNLWAVSNYDTNNIWLSGSNGNIARNLLVSPPIISTNDIQDVTGNSAKSGGNVISDGNASVTARGVCWSTSQNPTVANNKTIDGTGKGNFSSNLTGLKSNTQYFVRAYAENSVGISYGEEKAFTTLKIIPNQPQLVFPINLSINAELITQLIWNKVSNANNYILEIATDINFSTIIQTDENIVDTMFTTNELNQTTKYFWRVRAVSIDTIGVWSETWSFTTAKPEPDVVTLTYPTNLSNNIEKQLTLSWQIAPRATRYFLQVAKDEEFGDRIINNTNIEQNSFDVELDLNTKYFWRVRAANQYGSSEWSEVWSFTTRPDKPAQVTLLIPSDKSVDVAVNPFLRWSDLGNVYYHLQIAQDIDFIFKDVETDVWGVTWKDTLEKNTEYYWRVRAVNEFETGEWSEVWSFVTGTTVGVTDLLISDLKVYLDGNELVVELPNNWDFQTGQLSYTIHNLLGQKILTEYVNYGNSFIRIDSNKLPKGTLILSIMDNDIVLITKKLLLVD